VTGKEGGGDNWMNRIRHELESLGMGDIWENGRNNDKNVWVRISKRCDVERQNMEVNNERERSSLTLYNIKKQLRKGDIYRHVNIYFHY
jgi:hypothetical protein